MQDTLQEHKYVYEVDLFGTKITMIGYKPLLKWWLSRSYTTFNCNTYSTVCPFHAWWCTKCPRETVCRRESNAPACTSYNVDSYKTDWDNPCSSGTEMSSCSKMPANGPVKSSSPHLSVTPPTFTFPSLGTTNQTVSSSLTVFQSWICMHIAYKEHSLT